MTESHPLKNQRLLVIDDNPAIHEDFRKILALDHTTSALEDAEATLFGEASSGAKRTDFQIDSAFQGQDGLQKVRDATAACARYALAFIDVRMPPGWDGIETAAQIWNVDPDLQVVICTAYSDYSWDEMIAKVGQSDRLVILKKPFDNVEVLQLANALTEKWHLLQEARRQKSDLEIMVQQRTEELRASELRFRLIMENAADLIAIVGPNGQRLYNSPSYFRLLGYAPEELHATGAFEQVHPEDREKVNRAVQQTIDRGLGQVLEYRMQHKDGSWRTLESHGAPFRNATNAIEGVLVVARDITERKMLEVQLRHAQKLESIGQLAAGIAHEINTPTQFIGDNTRFVRDAFADLQKLLAVQDKLFDAARSAAVAPELMAQVEQARQTADLEYLSVEIPKALDQTLDGIHRVSKIVSAMKDFSHPGTDSKTMLDLNKAIESTLTVCRSEWKYVAELVTEFDPTLPPVPVLPGEFNQVVLNIIVNAAHAIADAVGDDNQAKGTITVCTRREGDWAELSIRDTGTGIPEKARDRIFDPFFTTKGVGKGTGQGLAIARSVVVDKHGGSVTFETELGKGTKFIIRLPLSERTLKETREAA
ncbi:MAG: PAS domain S-box protein [Verrucomicrobiales bacterium]|nr:PAS domain S-box protein [Verrucomicrobiales bacterium]